MGWLLILWTVLLRPASASRLGGQLVRCGQPATPMKLILLSYLFYCLLVVAALIFGFFVAVESVGGGK
jgi:hypothetical protein